MAKFFLLLLLSIPLACFAQPNESEYIDDFSAQLIVNKDATIDVSESITVHGDANTQRFARALPKTYTLADTSYRNRYQITQVRLNGYPVPYELKNNKDQLIIAIPYPPEKTVSAFRTFTIHYRLLEAIQFSAEVDRAYWNIPSQWPYPILNLRVFIRLPETAQIAQAIAFRSGDSIPFISVRPTASQTILTNMTPIPANSAISFSLTWQKGPVMAPKHWWFQNWQWQQTLL